MTKGARSELDPDPLARGTGTDPDPHQNVTDPQLWHQAGWVID